MKHIARCGILLALVTLTGCEQLGNWFDAMDKPTASLSGARLRDITPAGAVLDLDVDVSNPYSVSLPLADFDYKLTSDNTRFFAGQADLQGTVPAGATRTFTLPAEVKFSDALAVLSSVRPGQVLPYRADVGLSVSPPGDLPPVRLPLSHTGDMPIPTAPGVNVRQLAWQQLDLSAARGVMTVDLTNRNQFAVNLDRMNYALKLAGAEVANAGVGQALSWSPGQTQTISIPVQFSPRSLGTAAWNAVRGNATGYDLSGALNVTSAYGPMSLPLTSSGSVATTGN